MKNKEIDKVDVDLKIMGVKQVVKLIKLTIEDKKIVMTSNQNNEYFLNDKTINDILKNKLKGADISPNDEEDDMYNEVENIDLATSLKIEIINENNKSRPAGGFFNYQHKTIFDLSRYNIFGVNEKLDYNQNCIYIALKNGGLSER
jgi:hypothetical protein